MQSPYQCEASGRIDPFLRPVADGVFHPGLPRGYPSAGSRKRCPDPTPESRREKRRRFEAALLPGRTLGHDWGNDEEQPFGSAPAGGPEGAKDSKPFSRGGHRCLSETPLPHALHREAAVEAMCRTFSAFWILSPELSSSVAEAQEGLRATKPRAAIVAIHARGGDKKIELRGHLGPDGRFPLRAGLERLRDQQGVSGGADGGVVCVIVGDDLGYAEAAAQVMGLDGVN